MKEAEKEIVRGRAMEEHRYLEALVQRYKESYDTLLNEMEQTVVQEKLGSGGKCMHRGFYCPSPIQDIVIGNARRGRILKRKPTKRVPDYRFGFDKDGRLVVADQNAGDFGELYCKEFIFQENEQEIGIGFNKNWGLDWIAVCRYREGKIQSYVRGLCAYPSKNIYEMHREYYSYAEEGLMLADWFDDHWREGKDFPWSSNHYKYEFYHEDGYLSQYRMEEDIYYAEEYILEREEEDDYMLDKLKEIASKYKTFEEFETASFNHRLSKDIKTDIKLKRKI